MPGACKNRAHRRSAQFTIIGMALFSFQLAQLALIMLLPLAALAQQPPSQHAPSELEYREFSKNISSGKDSDASKSQVRLRWEALAEALRYEVRISRTPDFSHLVHTAGTVELDYVTPALLPGQYFYQVEAYRYERIIGKHSVKSFVIGKPLTLASSKQKLQAPQIVGPKHLDTFPTYRRVRLAWESVPGARGYRLRLWEEDKAKLDGPNTRRTPPRWITEVKQTWLEVHDAPYSSYMYLGSGTYRWDVAAIDKDGGYVGDPAMGYFQMSRQFHMNPRELFVRVQSILSPAVDYKSYSGVAGRGYEDAETASIAVRAEVDYFFKRNWGVAMGGTVSTLGFQAGLGAPVDYFVINLDALYRAQLSLEQRGWRLQFSLGLVLQEMPAIDGPNVVPEAVHIERPRVFGAHTGFRIHHRWRNPWEVQLISDLAFNAFWFHDPYGTGSSIKPTFNGSIEARGLYHFTKVFAGGLGLVMDYRSIKYDAGLQHPDSSVRIQSTNITLTGQFRY